MTRSAAVRSMPWTETKMFLCRWVAFRTTTSVAFVNIKAPTAADHCGHIKTMLGQLLDDGRKVYMKNPKPKYFDISLVFKPADRIAYTLKKVAAAGHGVIGGHDLAEIYGLQAVGSDPKYATLKALAAMRKEILPASRRSDLMPCSLERSKS